MLPQSFYSYQLPIPISLAFTLSKICQSVMHERLLKHCLENNIISDKQAAYLKGDSTVSQLLCIVHNIRKSWGEKQVLFIDVSSALRKFGTVGCLPSSAK